MTAKGKPSIDPLRPSFRSAASVVTGGQRGKIIEDILRDCEQAGADMELVSVALSLAAKKFTKKSNSGQPHNYSLMVAAGVARLGLNPDSPTKLESVIAALFEQSIADNPDATGIIRESMKAALRHSDKISLERTQAIDSGLRMAEQDIAPFSRIPRYFATKPDLPDRVFDDAQGMALAMADPRSVVVKLVGAMTLLLGMKPEDLRPVRTEASASLKAPESIRQREAQGIVEIAQRLYIPLCKKLGADEWAEVMKDKVFALREPRRYAEAGKAVEQAMGKDFYGSAPKTIEESTNFIKRLVEQALNPEKRSFKDPNYVAVMVYGRAKTPAALIEKVDSKQQEGKPYAIASATDIMAFRVVVPGSDSSLAYEAQAALLGVMHVRPNDCVDFHANENKPYNALHLVGDFRNGNGRPRNSPAVPDALKGLPVVEVQFRTALDDAAAEIGHASHGVYKTDRGMSAEEMRTRVTAMLPLLKRAGECRAFLAHVTARQKPKDMATPPAQYIVDGEGMPHRVPNGASLMDALYALNPNNVHARHVRINGVEAEVNSMAALRVRVKNAQSLVVKPGDVDPNVIPDAAWLQPGVMVNSIALQAVRQARHPTSRMPRPGEA